MHNLDYKLLHALYEIIQEQSFEKAANKLHISQSAISQRIKQLEQFVSKPVLIRSQPIELTEVGENLLAHYQKVQLLEHDLKSSLTSEQEDYVAISIAINADSLASWFIPALSHLMKNEKFTLDLQVTNETRTQMLLQEGKVSAALSSMGKSVSGCRVQELGKIDYIFCASPSFIARYFKNGVNQTSLKHAPGVLFDQQDSMHTDFIEANYQVKRHQYPCHRVRSSEAFVTMALEGVACCLLPHTQANQYLNSGELVELAPEYRIQQTLYWHSWVLEQGLHKQLTNTILTYCQKAFIQSS